MQALWALDHLHENQVSHGDLQKANFFIDDSHNGEKRLVLADFGKSIDWSDAAQAGLEGRMGCEFSAAKVST